MIAKRMYSAAIAVLFVAANGCGSRISLGDMGDGDLQDGGGAGAAIDAGAGPDASGAFDGGAADTGPLDAGPAPDGATAEDGGAAYVPCAGKKCGDTCKICNPLDINCVETAVVKQCNATAQCVSAPPGC